MSTPGRAAERCNPRGAPSPRLHILSGRGCDGGNSKDTLYDLCEGGGDGQIGVPDHGWSQLNATGSNPDQMEWKNYNNNNKLINTVQVTGGTCANVG